MKSTSPHRPQIFWGEISPCDHLVQIYESDAAFLDVLEGFVAAGIVAGEGVVIIAVESHRAALERRLAARGIDVGRAQAEDRFIVLDAQETLDTFMCDGWPDEEKFKGAVHGLLQRAGKDGRGVRAFGEMVALLWAQGHCGATVRLEYLWHRLCEERQFSLLCAYPKSGFTENAADSIRQICDAHSHVVQARGLVTRNENTFRDLEHRLHTRPSVLPL